MRRTPKHLVHQEQTKPTVDPAAGFVHLWSERAEAAIWDSLWDQGGDVGPDTNTW